jgi:GNAT superfamily N-acetyltransferase
MTIFRPAQETDLAQAYDVYYQNEIIYTPAPPAPGEIPSTLRHILRTGTMYVAEQDGHILAFASAITRDHVTFLTDMFVRPDQQSSQLGKTLLQYVLPHNENIRCTMSSTDPRALALYIRSGMQPQWPNFCLRLNGPIRGNLPTTDIDIVEGQANHPEFVRWDALISGRSRPIDHTFWIHEQRAVPLWFQRHGNTAGTATYAWEQEHFGIPKLAHLDQSVPEHQKMPLPVSWPLSTGRENMQTSYSSTCLGHIPA